MTLDPMAVVSIQVFQKDLTEVWALLARLNPVVAPSANAGVPATKAAWTEAELTALYRKCQPIQRAILVRIAEAGTKLKSVTYGDLRTAAAEAAKNPAFSSDKLRGNLAWISKYAFKVKGTPQWPVTFADRGPEHQALDRYLYEFEKPIAEMIIRISRAVK